MYGGMTKLKRSAKIEVMAVTENWRKIYSILKKFMEKSVGLSDGYNNILVACEEIFVNISKYAYEGEDKPGKVLLNVVYFVDERVFEVTFKDSGRKFNSAEAAKIGSGVGGSEIGGQGLVLVKKIMDKVEYRYVSGNNVLKLTKIFKRVGEV
jgi:anti-sigma regulatory factor (Ser/Thr protein kinase)